MLEHLRKRMSHKYNLTKKNDFDEFVSVVTEAVLIGSKTDWSFSAACAFTFATLTTVGKCHLQQFYNLVPFCLRLI